MPALFQPASAPASGVPLEPEEPLDPEDPLELDEPLEPEDPLDPALPSEPEIPWPPEELAVPGSVADCDVPGAPNSSLELAPPHAALAQARSAKAEDASASVAERGLMAAELHRCDGRCPTGTALRGDSFPSLEFPC